MRNDASLKPPSHGQARTANLCCQAQPKLGPTFDIKAFHERMLEDGGVPLTFPGAKVRAWIGPP